MQWPGTKLVALVLLLSTSASHAEQPQLADKEAMAPSSEAPSSPSDTTVVLRRDSPIRLMVMREVTTKTAHAGDRFPLHVDQDVAPGGARLIPAGTPAWGEVVSASESGVGGRSGKLSARLLYIELPGQKIALRGDAMSAGTPGAATTAAATIGFALLGAGPLGLMARGTNAKLKAGEIITGYVADDQGVAFPPSVHSTATTPTR